MSREQSYQSIILKKTAFNEADEIITVLTLENGKMRFLAKSIKLSKSKLQNNLQSLFLVNLRIAKSQSKLSKVIGSEVINPFAALRENLFAIKPAYVACELCIKFLPDEQKADASYNLLKLFLNFLNQANLSEIETQEGLLAFKIKFLETVGLAITHPQNLGADLFFESSKGGFINSKSSLGILVWPKTLEQFLQLKEANFKALPEQIDIKQLKLLVDNFLEYHLERKLKAEDALSGVV
jgi:DNA repair protein RecO (recombination protein O)